MNADLAILQSIRAAKEYLNKEYLDQLTEWEIPSLSERDRKSRFLRISRIEKIVYDKEEDVIDKLVSVYNAVSQFANHVILLVVGKKNGVEMYLGTQARRESAVANDILTEAFRANFPGSLLTPLDILAGDKLMEASVYGQVKGEDGHQDMHIGCLCAVPSLRNEKKEAFVQGIEKFIDTMHGQEYVCEIIASPLSNSDLILRTEGFEQIFSALYPFSKKSMAHGHNEGKTLTQGISDTISTSISEGISQANGTTTGITKGKNSGFNMGGHMLMSFGFIQGNFSSENRSRTQTDTDTRTDTNQSSRTKQTSETSSAGTTDSITIEHKDKGIDDLLEKLDVSINRMKLGAAYGLWDCGVYFIAPEKKTIAVASSAFRSLVLGDKSTSEQTHFNIFLGDIEKSKVTELQQYLRFGVHPRFRISGEYALAATDSLGEQQDVIVTPTSLVSGKELPLLLSTPRKSVNGVVVTSMTEFGRNVFSEQGSDDTKIRLGSIQHMEQVEETSEVSLSIEDFSSHCFITGSTGSGKSNTVFSIIERLAFSDTPIPFLVIEPAKGEYRTHFGGMPGIHIFGTNPAFGQMLNINPFYFHPSIHILEHLDRLVEIFNACWEMYAAMPAMLKDAIEHAYIDKGWDLLNSIYLPSGPSQYPTFSDVLIQLPKIIKSSSYSADTQGDYIGALVTRVSALTNGVFGQIFCSDFDIDDTILFDERTIIDLSRVGSNETKSLIMGLLVLRLNEYRMATATQANSRLKHITVLEEAHNLLKNTDNIRGTGGNQMVAKSVEMIVNSIAEMRTYGEGFIIVDQSPTSVDISAIKNTNTKIIMRLPNRGDGEIAGASISLNDDQIADLPRLKRGVAVIMQSGWTEAVLALIDKASDQYTIHAKPIPYNKIKAFRSEVVAALLDQYVLSDEYSEDKILSVIDSCDIELVLKEEMKRFIHHVSASMAVEFNSILLGRWLKRLTACDGVFRISEKHLEKVDTSEEASEGDPGGFTPDSLALWRKNINHNLNQYIELDDRHRAVLVQYIVYAQQYENNRINYKALYHNLYGIR